MKTIKKVLITLSLNFSILGAQSAMAGGGDLGGASLVLFKNCQVELVDFYRPDQQASLVEAHSESILKCFWGENTIVHKNDLLKDDTTFFPRTFSQLSKYFVKYPLFQTMYLINKVSQSHKGAGSTFRVQTTELPPVASLDEKFISQTVDSQIQVPFIAFNGSATIFSRFLNKSNNSIKERILNGASIHEFLRIVNASDFINKPFSTEEIEVLVRYFSNLSLAADTSMLPNLLSRLNDTTEKYQIIRKSVEMQFSLLLAAFNQPDLVAYSELSLAMLQNYFQIGQILKNNNSLIKSKIDTKMSKAYLDVDEMLLLKKLNDSTRSQKVDTTKILLSCQKIIEKSSAITEAAKDECGMDLFYSIQLVLTYPISLTFLADIFDYYKSIELSLKKSNYACYDVINFQPVEECDRVQ